MSYYLTYVIYPKYTALIQTIALPTMPLKDYLPKNKKFLKRMFNEHLECCKSDETSLKDLFTTGTNNIYVGL